MSDGPLPLLARNHYFYGKLLAVPQLLKEARFLNEVRWLVNRLAVGPGVLVGLDVVADTEQAGQAIIQPGALLDFAGREVVSAEPIIVDPHQPTDDQGAPAGAPLTSGTVELRIGYAEVKADAVPALVPECPPAGACEHDTIRVVPRVLVRPAGAPPPPPAPVPFPADPDALQQWLTAQVAQAPLAPPADPSVLLARIDLQTPLKIDTATGRPLVCGLPRLFAMLVALAGQARGPLLRYVSGDGQTATAGKALAAPLVVEAVDGAGAPVPDVTVVFEAQAGQGSATPAQATTDGQGRAQTQWKLGAGAGPMQLTAKALAAAFTVTFRATAK